MSGSGGRTYGDAAIYRRMLREARPYLGAIILVFVLNLLATPLSLLIPVPLKVTVDTVLGDQPLPGALAALLPAAAATDPAVLLFFLALFVVLVAVLLRIQGLAAWMLETWVGERLVLRFRTKLFRHLQRLSFRFHDAAGTSDSVYRVQYDAPSIQYVAVQGVVPLVAAFVKLSAMIAVTAAIDFELAAVALSICPLLFFLTRFYRRRLRRRWTVAKEVESRAMSVVQESLTAMRVVKAFGQEGREEGRYVAHANVSLLAHLKVIFAEGAFGLLVGLTTALGTAAVLWLGATHVREGTLSLGALLLVMAYLTQLYEPLREIGAKVGDIQKSLASAERAFRILDEVPEVLEAPDARPLGAARGEIAFEGVSFGYGDGPDVLREVTLCVPAGARVGIAGRTGAGKSTLLSLLPRFYDPRRGRILLDGADIREVKLADLRNQFSIVLQDPMLFGTSIAENIAYGRPDASREEIVAAAKAAAAHDFIAAMPEGYDTEVGERGLRLSGGERQRISVARAFLKDAPILILDEPTSSVDVATEAAIMEALERLMRGRTTFIIAHRLSTLDRCEVRLVLEDGRTREVANTLTAADLEGPAPEAAS